MDLVQQEMEVGAWGSGVCKGSTGHGLYSLLGTACSAHDSLGEISEFLYYFFFFSFGFSQHSKRKRHDTEGLVWLKFSPVSASWATQFSDCCVLEAPGPRDPKMKLWRAGQPLQHLTKAAAAQEPSHLRGGIQS